MIDRDKHRSQIDSNNPLTNTGAWIAVDRHPAKVAWRAVYVHHLSPAENGNQHNVFLDCLDETGAWASASALKIGYTWEGRRPIEMAPLRSFEKRPPEPRAQLDINKGQIITCWVEDPFAESDRVMGLRSNVEDVPGNNLYHNSFVVLFQKQWGNPTVPVEPEQTPGFPDLRAEVTALRTLVEAMQRKIDTWDGD